MKPRMTIHCVNSLRPPVSTLTGRYHIKILNVHSNLMHSILGRVGLILVQQIRITDIFSQPILPIQIRDTIIKENPVSTPLSPHFKNSLCYTCTVLASYCFTAKYHSPLIGSRNKNFKRNSLTGRKLNLLMMAVTCSLSAEGVSKNQHF